MPSATWPDRAKAVLLCAVLWAAQSLLLWAFYAPARPIGRPPFFDYIWFSLVVLLLTVVVVRRWSVSAAGLVVGFSFVQALIGAGGHALACQLGWTGDLCGSAGVGIVFVANWVLVLTIGFATFVLLRVAIPAK